MSGHTATPWETRAGHVYSTAGNVCSVGEPHASKFVGYTELEIGSPHANEAYANAAFIVTACNSHADLVKALEGSNAMLQLLRSMVDASAPQSSIDEQVKINSAALATLTARKVG